MKQQNDSHQSYGIKKIAEEKAKKAIMEAQKLNYKFPKVQAPKIIR